MRPTDPRNNNQLLKVSAGPARWLVLTAVVGISVAWGSTFLAYQVSLSSFPPFALISIRFIVGGVLLYGWGALRTRSFVRPTRTQWISAAITGVFLFAIGNGALVWSQQHLSSAVGGLLVGTIPLWTAAFAVVGFRVRIPPSELIAVLFGLGGTAMLLVGTGSSIPSGSLLAVLIALLGVASWSFGSLLIRDRPSHQDPMVSAGLQMLSGGFFLTILGFATGEFGSLLVGPAPTASAWIGLIYLAVPNALTYGTFVWLLSVASPLLVSSYAYLSPLVAVFLGWWFLDDRLTPLMLWGALIVLISVAILGRHPRIDHSQQEIAPAGIRQNPFRN